MAHIYLGIDIGTTSAKCLAVAEDGRILALVQHPYPMAHPRQGWTEQDPGDYWRALVDCVNRCASECERLGYSRDKIASLAISTQGDTLILTDSSGIPLYPAISWMDSRAESEFKELISNPGASFWYRETGAPLSIFSSACAIRWIARSRSDIWGMNPRICYVADFLAMRLCGRFAADVPGASWTPLYSPLERSWSRPVLELLDISPDALADVVESGDLIAELLPNIADELGLSANTRLIAGAFDQAAAAYGAGATADGRSILSCGTAWVLYSVSPRVVYDKDECLCTCCHTSADEWGLVLPFTGGSAYDWLNRTLGEKKDSSRSSGEELIFIPHLYGGLSPDWRGESKGSLLGLTLAHTQADIRCAMMRGLAFEARRNLEAAEPYCGRTSVLRMVGGAGKSETWPQLIANIVGRPVEVSECVESACYGAAKLAAGKVSESWTDAQPPRRFAPVSNDVENEQRLYERYLQCYQSLLSLYK